MNETREEWAARVAGMLDSADPRSKKVHYHIGWNMPGYLPEMDPWMLTTAEDAKSSMIDAILFDAEHEADEDNAETLSALAEDLNLAKVEDGWDGWTDRLHYWIMPCEEECEREEW